MCYNKHMKLTEKQFAKIEHLMPTPRRKPEVSNYDFLCALLYIIENGCKWRALPSKYGNWHTIYVRFNRWCKSGVIDRIFEALQEENIILISFTHNKIRKHYSPANNFLLLYNRVPPRNKNLSS